MQPSYLARVTMPKAAEPISPPRTSMAAATWVSTVVLLLLAGCSDRMHLQPIEQIDGVSSIPLVHLAAENGIRVYVRQESSSHRSLSGPITAYSKVSLDHLLVCVPMITEELRLYPPRFLETSGVRRIVLSGVLRTGKSASGGLNFPDEGTIDLCVCPDSPGLAGGRQDSYSGLRDSLHHEIWHQFGDRHLSHKDRRAWLALSPAPDTSGKQMPESCRSSPTLLRQTPGFLTDYGMTSPDEDRAEFFAAMITHYRAAELAGKIDPLVACKMNAIKTLVSRYCPSADKAFWTSIQNRDSASGNPTVAALQCDWLQLNGGVDPMNPDTRTAGRLLLRPTRCSGFQNMDMGACGITITDSPLKAILTLAYGVPSSRVLDLTGLDQVHYDLIAPMGADQFEEVQGAVRGLLQDQIGVVATRTVREMEVLILQPGEGERRASTVRNTATPQPAESMTGWAVCDLRPYRNVKRITLTKATPLQLGDSLEGLSDVITVPIVVECDKPDQICSTLEYEPGDLGSLNRVLCERIGLRLTPARRAIELLVVTLGANATQSRPAVASPIPQ